MKNTQKQTTAARRVKKDVRRSYNVQKEFDGERYTGMQVGRSHKWNYAKGVWRETKVTPDRLRSMTCEREITGPYSMKAAL